MTGQDMPFERLLAMAQGEYREMPGLRLTRAQAQRLWDLPCSGCAEAVLEALTDMHLVRETRGGMFASSAYASSANASSTDANSADASSGDASSAHYYY